jgi:hypothetical protein
MQNIARFGNLVPGTLKGKKLGEIGGQCKNSRDGLPSFMLQMLILKSLLIRAQYLVYIWCILFVTYHLL